jgi:aminodeoxyfutalosine synthase
MFRTPCTSCDPALEPIRQKVLAGERLSREDGLVLYNTRDIFTLGELAELVRRRLHGRRAYYVINRHINYTNFCVLRCKFCSFYRPYPRPGQPVPPDAYELSVEQVADLAAEAAARGATEVHIVGGLHPKLPFSYYLEMCRAIRQRCPTLHIKAFTAVEIIHFARLAGRTVEQVLAELREAGLNSLPGGGAEIFDPRVQAQAFRGKAGQRQWFEVHRTAHDLGIPSNATMLYGHIETIEQRVDHLLKLRDHQDESLRRMGLSAGALKCWPPAGYEAALARGRAAFQCFVPLPFIPEGSAFSHLAGPTGLDDLRTLAVARLLLDNFPHIKAFWPMLSPKLAQLALNWGVDDFDGTVVRYDITRREGRGANRQELTVDQICRLILEAGCEPVERDALYRPVVRAPAGRG